MPHFFRSILIAAALALALAGCGSKGALVLPAKPAAAPPKPASAAPEQKPAPTPASSPDSGAPASH